jgi:predicted ATPase
VGWGQCIEQYGAGEAYLPVLEALGWLGRQTGGERLLAILHQYAPTWLVQLSTLLSPAELEAVQRRVQGATRERMLREIAEALDVVTADHPLALVLEDLHWSDPSTVELLALLARRREAARLLVLGTYRPVELVITNHPLKAMKQELVTRRQGVEVLLGGLSREAVQTYVSQRVTQPAPHGELAAFVHQRTEGHPLFMVQVTDYLLQREGAAALTQAVTQAVPDGLQQLIEVQLGHLGAEAQQVLEVASVAGAEFIAASVAAGSQLEPGVNEEICEGLARREQFIEERGVVEWPDGTVSGCYGFRHALYQQVLYQRVAEARRVRLHQVIGGCQECAYGERGRDYQRATHYRRQAADTAMQRNAYNEAETHCTSGLALLPQLPDTPGRAQLELSLQMTLGLVLAATKGFAAPEVEQAYLRVRALCEQTGEPT